MRKELFIHFCFCVSFIVFITLIKHYFSFGYWPFWLGGLLGVVLPDIDHLLYVYFLSPQDLSSQRINFLMAKSEVVRGIELLYETRSERKGLIFHSIFFQLIFFILTFWVLSSSGSLLGRGLVLSFALHLCIDQLVDLNDLGNLDNWFRYLPFKLDFKQSKIYFAVSTALVLIMGFLM